MTRQTAPIAMAFRAESMIVAAAGRGVQPNTALALAELNTCLRRRSGVTNRIGRWNSATVRSTRSGMSRVGTFFAATSSSDRKTSATSAIQTQSLSFQAARLDAIASKRPVLEDFVRRLAGARITRSRKPPRVRPHRKVKGLNVIASDKPKQSPATTDTRRRV